MRIKEITVEHILFDNGNEITFDHVQDCCESNYADFEQIDTAGRNHDYDEELVFEFVEDGGFRFGDGNFMTFIPCYSVQNGYYTDWIDIYYKGKIVCSGLCEEVLD